MDSVPQTKCVKDAHGNCSRWCTHPKAEQTRDELALAVAELWVQQNAWIPGGAKPQLEAVLGLPLPTPAVGDIQQDNQFTYKTSDPRRLHSGRETYSEWKARQ